MYSFGCMSRVHSPFPTCACTFFCFRQWLACWTTLNRTNGTDGQEGLNEDSSWSDGRCIVSELWLLVTLMETQPPPFNLFLQYVRSESSGPFLFFKKKSEVWTSIGRTSAFPNFFLGWCAIMQHISIGESKLTNIPQALDEWGRMEGIFPVQVTTGNDRWVRYARSIFWSTIPHEGSLQSIGKFFFSHAWTFSICLNKLQP